MNTRLLKWGLFMVLVVLMMSGCEGVVESRAEFCGALEDVGTLAADFKSAKGEDPIDDFKAKLENLEDKKETLDRLADLSPGDRLDNFLAAVEEVAGAVRAAGDTLGPQAEKIRTAGGQLESAYQDIDEAVCSEL